MEQELNPYAPPGSESEPTPGHGAPTVELFTPSQVAWASFLASVGAGVALITINERRLGRGNRGLWVLLPALGILCVAVFVESMPSLVIGGGGALVMYLSARSMFGEDVDEHFRKGGPRATGGAAVGWALLGMLLALALIFALAFAAELA